MKKDSTPQVKVQVVYSVQEGLILILRGLGPVKSVKQAINAKTEPWESVRLDSTLLKAVLNVIIVKRGRSPALLDRVFVPSAGRVTSAVRVLRLLAEWASILV